MKLLVVVDMQNDFLTGVLGNPETAGIVGRVAEMIQDFRQTQPDGMVIATLDTHDENYLATQEGQKLPVPHCIKGTDGWMLAPEIAAALGNAALLVEKRTFGAIQLPDLIPEVPEEILIAGVCTDICVISNAMILKAAFPEVPVTILQDCCAGVTPKQHENALAAMAVCQMNIR